MAPRSAVPLPPVVGVDDSIAGRAPTTVDRNSGGEVPAMVLIDAVVRLIPGVLGDDESTHHESFSPGAQRLLDYPHYTKPREWMGMETPEVLLSGDHAKIEAWRKSEALRRTRERRPDLLDPA